MLLSVLYAAVASTAFSVIFNVQGRSLVFAGLCSGLGYFVYLATANLGNFLQLLLASITISLVAEFLARRNKAPSTLFLIAGLIPLVPGGEIFQFFVGLLEGASGAALRHFLVALLQAGALACGIVLVSAFLNFLGLIRGTGKNR